MNDEYKELQEQMDELREQEAKTEAKLRQIQTDLTAHKLKLGVLHLEDRRKQERRGGEDRRQ